MLPKTAWAIPFVVLFSLLLSLLLLPSPFPLSAQEPSEKALERLGKLRMTHAGVDRQGYFWAWNRNSRSLRVLSPAGEMVLVREIDGEFPTLAVFDSGWGIAALDLNRVLVVESPVGAEAVRIPLDEDVREMAWIGPGRLALSPSGAGHRVEIWDVERRQRVATWGEAEPVPEGPGLHRVRNVYLAWDGERKWLWTLESFTGEVVVFNHRGLVVGRQKLYNENRSRLENFLLERNKEKLDSGEREETSFERWSGLALQDQEQVALVHNCHKGTVQVLQIPLSGEPVSRTVTAPCCPTNLLLWGQVSIYWRSSLLPDQCFITMEKP